MKTIKQLEEEKLEKAIQYCKSKICKCGHNLWEHGKEVKNEKNIGCSECDCSNFKYKLEKTKEKEQEVNDKVEWITISSEEQITSKPIHLGKTYQECIDLLKEGERIADYPLIQKLRNSEEFQKYFKDFWVFVPNPDYISLKNKYVARFYADSDGADLGCGGNPAYTYSSLGVFVVRQISREKIK